MGLFPSVPLPTGCKLEAVTELPDSLSHVSDAFVWLADLENHASVTHSRGSFCPKRTVL